MDIKRIHDKIKVKATFSNANAIWDNLHRTERNGHSNGKKVSNIPILSFLLRELHLYSALHQRVKLRKEKKKEKRKNWSTRGRRKERGKPRRKGTMEGNRSEGNNLAARARG